MQTWKSQLAFPPKKQDAPLVVVRLSPSRWRSLCDGCICLLFLSHRQSFVQCKVIGLYARERDWPFSVVETDSRQRKRCGVTSSVLDCMNLSYTFITTRFGIPCVLVANTSSPVDITTQGEQGCIKWYSIKQYNVVVVFPNATSTIYEVCY